MFCCFTILQPQSCKDGLIPLHYTYLAFIYYLSKEVLYGGWYRQLISRSAPGLNAVYDTMLSSCKAVVHSFSSEMYTSSKFVNFTSFICSLINFHSISLTLLTLLSLPPCFSSCVQSQFCFQPVQAAEPSLADPLPMVSPLQSRQSSVQLLLPNMITQPKIMTVDSTVTASGVHAAPYICGCTFSIWEIAPWCVCVCGCVL